ncbi:MAG: type II toxin-antitoxin system HicB family antitoxin [Waddliaceae bacterium]
MKYKGYTGKVIFDEDAKIFHGEVVGIKDVVTFQGTTVEELEQAFKDSVDEYLDFCRELDRKPEKPFSGKFILRVDPEVHERMAYEARNCGMSLNSWVKDAILQILSSRGFHSTHNRLFHD